MRGVAAVVVTHDAHLASWADRVVRLQDGRLVDYIVPDPPDPPVTYGTDNVTTGRKPAGGSR